MISQTGFVYRLNIGVLVLSLACLSDTSTIADGFRNPPPGAVAVGKVAGNIAHINDATAVTINPANLVEIDHKQVLPSLTIGYGVKEFSPAMGSPREKTDEPWSLLPSIFAVVPVPDKDITFGIGLYVPFGRFTDFGEDAAFGLISPYYAELYVVDINPTLAWKVNEHLSVAAGLDFYGSHLRFDQGFPWAAVTGVAATPAGITTFEGDGVALGGHAALTWRPDDRHTLAVTYKSSFDMDYEGDFKASNVPAAAQALGVTPTSDFDAEIQFPSVLAFGYGLDYSQDLRFGFDVEWIEHSRNVSLPIDIKNNNALLPVREVPQAWDDNFTVGAGVEYDIDDTWTARAGYIFLETPTPQSTFIPAAAEADQSVISVGLGRSGEKHSIDFAYAYGIFDARKVTANENPLLNGTYDFESHLISVSYRIAL